MNLRVDLHRHLEGSHSPAALAAVAATFDIRHPLFFDASAQRFRAAADLAPALTMAGPTDDAFAFYACIQKARAAYVSEEAIEALARAAFVEAAAETDGFEMRVSLFSMTRTLFENEGVAWRERAPVAFAERARAILRRVLRARDDAQAEAGKPMLVRVGFTRTFESEAHTRALAAMLAEHRDGVCGLDVLGIVAGPDREPMPDALRDILEGLRAHLPDLTVHAGELADHRSVDRTLALEPHGIGHGVRSLESDETLARLVSAGVTLEVCPTSNRLLIPRVVSALEATHEASPLVALQRADVRCVLGSDDPTPMGTSFSAEWRHAFDAGVDLHRLAADSARRWQQITGAPFSSGSSGSSGPHRGRG